VWTVAWWVWLVVVVAAVAAVALLTLGVQARRRSGTVIAVRRGRRARERGVP
jgi:heme exporter protein D